MSDPSARTFNADFKRFFVRGLVVLLPTVLTLWIAVKAYQFVDNAIAAPINGWVRTGMVQAAKTWRPLQIAFDPSESAIGLEEERQGTSGDEASRERIRSELRAAAIEQWWAARWYMDLIGLMVAIAAVYIVGRLLGGFVGRTFYRNIETILTRFPVFKQVYPHVKQVVDFLFSGEKRPRFNRVVVVEYPRQGIWSLGLLTGDTLKAIAEQAGDSVTVFIPSSPTPFTGYTITVPRRDVREVPISVDEALRFTVSGGVLVPDHQKIRELAESGALSVPESPAPMVEGSAREKVTHGKVKSPERRRRDAG
jgi:uncharacterized membrane protein